MGPGIMTSFPNYGGKETTRPLELHKCELDPPHQQQNIATFPDVLILRHFHSQTYPFLSRAIANNNLSGNSPSQQL